MSFLFIYCCGCSSGSGRVGPGQGGKEAKRQIQKEALRNYLTGISQETGLQAMAGDPHLACQADEDDRHLGVQTGKSITFLSCSTL